MVVIWVSGTPEHFLIHMHSTVYIIKQMDLDSKVQEATNVLENLKIDWGIAQDDHSKAKKEHKKKKDDKPPHAACSIVAAKTALDKACTVWEEARAKAEVIGTQVSSFM